MTTEKLSPDEISGLLGRQNPIKEKKADNSLTTFEQEAITELFAVALGSSSADLSLLLSEQVNIMPPNLAVMPKEILMKNAKAPFHVVLGEYAGGVKGIQFLSIDKKSVETITQLVDSKSEAGDVEKQFEVVQQVVQQMFTSASRSMSTVLDVEVAYSLSGMDIIDNNEDFQIGNFTKEESFVEADFQMQIGTELSASFCLYIPVKLAQHIVSILTDTMIEENPEEIQSMEFQSNNQTSNSKNTQDPNTAPNIQSVQFSSFDETITAQAEPNNLNMLLDIPLQVTVELGRTKRMVKEILGVSQGSIIELDKLAGEPVDILINNKLIAVGEVVVIDENFGVRVTDILSTADRISKLR
ncbi:flagellar motor switch phosphatase FliY [Planomicrobium sp. CPCC 101110]|uniref:flagellar motor switch phosphatase FliY n=1 Tax=Planomicrobium sp. CPCC 101110 TaxID=2599619 RepID=UPI0011B4336D|nr:flagellar motor switch phosphatase FliY [Planomicrobium sp. CPCC 101110]TWT27834.1 flagellar motor switch phosphatase FliY [Planomicrobium sp. CPCC 101110]